jgi:hypothetical protein
MTTTTYGGFRRKRGVEALAGLPGGATGSVLLVVNLLVLNVAGLRVTLWTTVLSVVVFFLATVKIGDATIGGHAVHTLLRSRARHKGWLRFHALKSADVDRWAKPGVLQSTQMLDYVDNYGQRTGIVLDATSGRMTAVLNVASTTTWLSDPDVSERWVHNWGDWLANLGYVPGVVWVSVVVETTPSAPTALADRVLSEIDPGAPQDCVTLVRSLADIAPVESPTVATRIAITWDAKHAGVKAKDEAPRAAAFFRDLQHLEADLGSCGMTPLGRATAPEVSALVASAYDPERKDELDRTLRSPDVDMVRWADAGPLECDETDDGFLQHDGYRSVTFGWREPPRQQFVSTVLADMLSPGPFSRRVAVLYRALPAVAASELLEGQRNRADMRAHLNRSRKGRQSARDDKDMADAELAASEEAAGAGVVNMSVYVTTTVPKDVDLDDATADVVARAGGSKIQLRRLNGAHAAGFVATLPIGIHPADLKKKRTAVAK